MHEIVGCAAIHEAIRFATKRTWRAVKSAISRRVEAFVAAMFAPLFDWMTVK
jgi:hypothetical protein